MTKLNSIRLSSGTQVSARLKGQIIRGDRCLHKLQHQSAIIPRPDTFPTEEHYDHVGYAERDLPN
jgi:hypothetical protein